MGREKIGIDLQNIRIASKSVVLSGKNIVLSRKRIVFGLDRIGFCLERIRIRLICIVIGWLRMEWYLEQAGKFRGASFRLVRLYYI